MPTVALQHVTKAYSTKIAVDDLSLEIGPGIIFGLLGPNGAGKTSSIRMMIGMTVPDSGSVILLNKPFARKSLQRVGYLPEERGLYKKMKILDQLVLMGELHGMEAKQASQRAHSWCERRSAKRCRRRRMNSQRGCSRKSNSSRPCCMIRS